MAAGQNVANMIVMNFSATSTPATPLSLVSQEAFSNKTGLKVENNVESAGNVVVQPKDSADGVTYANLGSALTVVPGGAAIAALSGKQYLQFVVSGNGAGRLILTTDERTQHKSQLP